MHAQTTGKQALCAQVHMAVACLSAARKQPPPSPPATTSCHTGALESAPARQLLQTVLSDTLQLQVLRDRCAWVHALFLQHLQPTEQQQEQGQGQGVHSAGGKQLFGVRCTDCRLFFCAQTPIHLYSGKTRQKLTLPKSFFEYDVTKLLELDLDLDQEACWDSGRPVHRVH